MAIVGGCLLAAAPAGGLLKDAANPSLTELLGMRSPGERPAGARSNKRALPPAPTYRVKPAFLEDAPVELPEDIVTLSLAQEPAPILLEEEPVFEGIDVAQWAGPIPTITVYPDAEITRTQPIVTPVGEVPEPATWLSMVMGFACLGIVLRARQRTTLPDPEPGDL